MRLIWHLRVHFPLPILNTGNLPTHQASHPGPRGGEWGQETAFPVGTEPALRRGLIDNPLGLFYFTRIFKVLNFRKIAFLTLDMASHGFIRSVQAAQKASSQLGKKHFVWSLSWPFTRQPLPIPTSETNAEAAAALGQPISSLPVILQEMGGQSGHPNPGAVRCSSGPPRDRRWLTKAHLSCSVATVPPNGIQPMCQPAAAPVLGDCDISQAPCDYTS